MINAFSFCLYGPYKPMYYIGMIENIELIARHFPSWRVFIYAAPDVEADMITKLQSYTNVILKFTGVTGPINMVHRFYAIDEPGVDIMMVRDADSRVHWKDRWAIREFLKYPQFVAHTIRDNVAHTTQIMGGLWGLRKSAGLNITNEYRSYNAKASRHGHDQDFLADVIYQKVLPRLLVHYSCGRVLSGELAVEFPFDWTNDVYCGRVEHGSCGDSQQPSTLRAVQTTPLEVIAFLERNKLDGVPTPSPITLPIRMQSSSAESKSLSFLFRK